MHFKSDYKHLTVFDAENDRTLCVFVDGVYSTDDPRAVDILMHTDGVFCADDDGRCTAIKANGERCKGRAMADGLCNFHLPKSTEDEE